MPRMITASAVLSSRDRLVAEGPGQSRIYSQQPVEEKVLDDD